MGLLVGPGARLERAALPKADLRSANLSRALLKGANLKGAQLDGVRMDGARLERANLTGAHMSGAWLIKARLDDAVLIDADLARAHLDGAVLAGAEIQGADFRYATMAGTVAAETTGTPKALPRGWHNDVSDGLVYDGDDRATDFRGVDLRDAEEGDLPAPSDPRQVRHDHNTVWPGWYSGPRVARPPIPQTAEFRKWFGKSMVVDANGDPLIVYHGTSYGGFTRFDLDKIDEHHNGFFFTGSRKMGETYMMPGSASIDPTPPLSNARDPEWSTPGVIEVYLSLKDPLIVNAKGSTWANIPFKAAAGLAHGVDRQVVRTTTTDDISFYAKREGYDGAIILNVYDSANGQTWDEPGDVYIAFRPTQIKSALFNSGAYSPRSPDIRKNPRRKTSRKPRKATSKRKTSRRR
jgi:hypothetical protein